MHGPIVGQVHSLAYMDKTGRGAGAGDWWIKRGDWELGVIVNNALMHMAFGF